jgi:AraC-like DNA-binding protein/quercetin dioxygenase-like cupin family protein
MKASFELLQTEKKQSFIIRKFDKNGFTAPYHYHPAYELTWIESGEGKRYVGNNMSDFKTGDLVLLGSNLPHCWKLSNNNKNKKASSIVIQFENKKLLESFFGMNEFSNITRLLKKSSSGICFSKQVSIKTSAFIQKLFSEKNDFQGLILLFELLQMLSLAKDFRLLNDEAEANANTEFNHLRLHEVFAYIVENYRKNISLDKAAAKVNMTPNAFCKYFKQITRKTFIETVTDYRINFATQQLAQTDASISSICFDSGFNDVSHFHKTFRSKMQVSPLQYRKKIMSV